MDQRSSNSEYSSQLQEKEIDETLQKQTVFTPLYIVRLKKLASLIYFCVSACLFTIAISAKDEIEYF